MKVLIVDDSRAMRMLILRALRQAGFHGHEYAEAEDGAHALERIRDWQPDVVLTDWNMPGMSGIELVEALGGDGPVVGMVTSEGTPEQRDRALAAGAAFVVTKPFTPEKFADALDGVLA